MIIIRFIDILGYFFLHLSLLLMLFLGPFFIELLYKFLTNLWYVFIVKVHLTNFRLDNTLFLLFKDLLSDVFPIDLFKELVLFNFFEAFLDSDPLLWIFIKKTFKQVNCFQAHLSWIQRIVFHDLLIHFLLNFRVVRRQSSHQFVKQSPELIKVYHSRM